jgi:iron complex transport system substrate-binding protein
MGSSLRRKGGYLPMPAMTTGHGAACAACARAAATRSARGRDPIAPTGCCPSARAPLPRPASRRVRASCLALTAAAALLTSACGAASGAASATASSGRAAQPAAASASATPAATAYPLTVTDDTGRSVIIPAAPRRIVSLTLGTDEILAALVGPSRLVGVTTYASDPGSSFVAVRVKGLPGLSANAEQVIALHPDVVFAADYTKAGVVQQLTAAGIPVVEFTTFSSLADIEAHIRTIGRIVAAEQPAAQLVAAMDAEVASVQGAVSGQPKPTVVFYSNGYLFGKGTTIDEVIADAGGVDAAAAAGFSGWTQVGPEEIVRLNPDVILTDGATGDDADQGGAAQKILGDPAYKGVTAVQHRAVWELSTRADSDVAQYMAWDVQDVAAILHPGQVRPYTPAA